MDKVDVLVIGAGPTGLMMAAEVRRHGLSCRILDRGQSFLDFSRAVAIQARTMEIFFHLGIVEDFLAQGIQVRAANPVGSRKRLARVGFHTLDSPYPFILSLEQARTEEILKKHLSSLGVEVEKCVELIDLEQDKDEVRASVFCKEEGSREEVTSSWLIDCEGAHSVVRKILNLSFEGKAFSETFSLADVCIDWEYPHDEFFVFLEARGVLGAIPLPEEKRYRLIFQVPLEPVPLEPVPIEQRGEQLPSAKEVEALLREYAGIAVRVYSPRCFANFHINSRMTSSYFKGRVFLAGDAAHIHSPIGGQGMNTGLQDAFNLAWKLALVHRKKVGKELLKTYDIERSSVGKKLLRATETASFLAILHAPWIVFLRNQIIRFLLRKVPLLISRIPKMLSQTGICYPKTQITWKHLSLFSPPKRPKVGMRAPNGLVVFKRQPSDLYTIWKGSTTFWVLYFFSSSKELKQLSTMFACADIQILTVVDAMNSPLDAENVVFCSDPTGQLREKYKAKSSSVWVMRPDLYIGYYKRLLDIEDLRKYFSFLQELRENI